MAKLRVPRDLDKYEPTEAIAACLERLAAGVRARSGLAKFSLKLSLWDPRWNESNFDGERIITGLGLANPKNK